MAALTQNQGRKPAKPLLDCIIRRCSLQPLAGLLHLALITASPFAISPPTGCIYQKPEPEILLNPLNYSKKFKKNHPICWI